MGRRPAEVFHRARSPAVAHGSCTPGARQGACMKFLPTTRLGSAASWLALASIIMFAIGASISIWITGGTPHWLRAYNATAFAAGFAGGVCALFAMLRQRERALAVYLALIPALLVALFVLFAE